jgi:O-antigen/teichoic acid export membrane protein
MDISQFEGGATMSDRNVWGQAENVNLTEPVEPDLTGRDRLVKNVLSSWAGHMVFVIAGFIMPRLIDHRVGQSGLGVWDFGWSLISYFAFVQAGIASSVNRYIAKYRAVRDTEGVRCTFCSVFCFQFVAGILVMGLNVLATWLVPTLLSNRLGQHVEEARWVVFFLGMSMALEVMISPFAGVISGCHRWDLHNGLNAGFHAGIVVAWIVALSLGGGLRSLALINFLGVVLTEITRIRLAFWVCPELRFHPRYVHWTYIRRMLTFGGKSILTTASRVLLYQTSNLLVVSFLGPAALAMYSRPGGLVRHAMTFVNKFAFVLTPTASCLHARGQKEELSELLIETTRYAAYITLPMVIFLSIMGSPLLMFWMGPKYRQGTLLIILAVGHVMTMIQQPVWNILAGMNVHGRLGVANLIAAVVSLGLALLALGVFHLGLIGAALAVVLPLSITYGVYIPLYACRLLGMSVRSYLTSAMRKPLLCVLPFTGCLFGVRYVFAGRPMLELLTGIVVGGLTLGLVYWRYVLSPQARRKVKSMKKQPAGNAALAEP